MTEEQGVTYEQIVRELTLDTEADLLAAQILNELSARKTISFTHVKKSALGHNYAVVFGAGVSLHEDFKAISATGFLSSSFIFAADGASSLLLTEKVTPHIIATDLDGRLEDLYSCWEKGSILAIHGHGENTEKLKEFVPRVTGRILPTTQVQPFGRLHNFGGFTDGDRAVHLAVALGFSKIILLGMDLGPDIGSYSKDRALSPSELERKRRKFSIAKRLLTQISKQAKARIYNASARADEIEGIFRVSISDLQRILLQH